MPTGSLPSEGKALWERVYESAKKSSTCKDAGDRMDECAARVAWTAVKNAGWKKDASGNWHKAADLEEFSLTIKKASFDNNQRMRWRADTSDIDDDSYGDNMTLELFQDFVDRIKANELAPEGFRSDYWQGGMPYLSVSHYPDLNGKAVPGLVESVWVDGKYLKSSGEFLDTPLGRACFKAAHKSIHSEDENDKVRISIAFLDWAHKHKSNGYLFERKSLDDFCPECLKELINGQYEGREFLKGQLVHFAQTKVPVNKRTIMEVEKAMAKTRQDDAASIIGEELAEQLEEESKLVGKSEALIIKSEDDQPEAVVEKTEHGKDMPPNKHAEDEEYPDCKDEKTGEVDPDCVKMHQEKKADVVEQKAEVVTEVAHTNWDMVYNAVLEIKALVTPKETPAHPLDQAILKLKADYDQTAAMEGSVDGKMQSLQQIFSEFGQVMVNLIRSSTPESKAEVQANDIAKQIENMLMPLAQKMELIATQVQQLKQMAQPGQPEQAMVIPRSRAIDPATVMQSAQSSVSQSVTGTPNLRRLIEKTTY